MDTRTICLGVLTRGDATGYEIKKCVEDEFGYFLEVSHSSIYPALADLRRDGQVTCTEVRQDGRPDKKVYRITDTGREAFVAGLGRSPGRHRVRSEFIALLLFAEFLPVDRVCTLIDARRAEFERILELCLDDSCEASAGARFAAGLGARMLSAGIAYMDDNRGWLEAQLAGTDAKAGGNA